MSTISLLCGALVSFLLQIDSTILIVFVLPAAAFLLKIVYNLTWHPLRRFPGPKTFAASRFPYVRSAISGTLAVTLHKLHEQYGPIVRTAPDELSFIDPAAWGTIYQHQPKRGVYRKNYETFNDTQNHFSSSIFIANDVDHKRMRKVLNHAFSPRALREQETLIKGHVRILLEGIDLECETNHGVVDFLKWYNWASFDIMADLAFGEPFNTLQDPTYRPWIHLMSKTWKVVTFVSSVKSIIPSVALFRFLLPQAVVHKQLKKFNIIVDRVRPRFSLEPSRPDFLSSIKKHNTDEEGLTFTEVISNASLFVAAGSETVATLLPALTCLLTQNPDKMARLVREIRSTYTNKEDITITNASQLQYLHACIDEALRLFPPVPEGLPRITPPSGDSISGQWIPGDTYVQVSSFAACHSASNFVDADQFLPERWLPHSEPRFLNDKRGASQPFSIGPRNCIGQDLAMAEARLIIASVLWCFNLSMIEGERDWMKQSTYMLWEKEKALKIRVERVKK